MKLNTSLRNITKKPTIKVKMIKQCPQCGFKAGGRKRECPNCEVKL
jgi:rubrerythrin